MLRSVNFRDNLLAQFSVVTFVIMVILALIISMIMIEILNRNIELLGDYNNALVAGEPIDEGDPFSIQNLRRQVSNLKWVTLGAVGGSFLYLYATLVYMVWEGWRTIIRQRVELEAANAVLEERVAERVQDLRDAIDEGNRRIDAFWTAAGRLVLEEVPERALEDLVDGARGLVGSTYGALLVIDSDGAPGKMVVSGFRDEQRKRFDIAPSSLAELGLAEDDSSKITVGDSAKSMSAHGLSDDASIEGFLGVPVTVRGRSAGALYLMGKEDDEEFTEDDERLLNLFGVLASVNLENVTLYDEVAFERNTLAAIQGSMTEGLVVLDPGGRVTYFNDTAKSLWGFNSRDISGMLINEVFGANTDTFESPEHLERLIGLTNGRSDAPSAAIVTLNSPRRRHLEVTAFSIPGAPGQGMTGLLARDITQEQELQDRRNAFVSIASHELRTPMTTIMGFSELLLNPKVPDDSRRQWTERIHENSQILSAIVDDMLDVSRIQTGRLALSLESIGLKGVIDQILSDINPDREKHDFVIEVSEDVPEVIADPEKLSQIIINLVSNAIKYSPEGGTITIAAHHEEDKERVVTIVSDQGIGIAKEELDQLFSTFHRIRRPETEGIKGTGLGLSIVKGLAVMMRGDAWVETEIDKGSQFYFSMPIRRVDMEEGAWQASNDSGGTDDEKGAAG